MQTWSSSKTTRTQNLSQTSSENTKCQLINQTTCQPHGIPHKDRTKLLLYYSYRWYPQVMHVSVLPEKWCAPKFILR
ncbi:Uncharacterized protein TCM_025282 [Theobroma cacao]|uniref:Uncharacterized protein n=1 Tax=Theobroma cacao TaxID=3641 RepID=A0A061F5W5_THECC|nr:Uncharacterized protein TCM_025282 [Theobroma cacao]